MVSEVVFMGSMNSKNSARNAEIIELRKSGYTLDKIGKMYDLSVSTVYRICFNGNDEDIIVTKTEREKRNNDIYELICQGHTTKYISDLYGLTRSNVNQIYYKVIAKQSELYHYFKSISITERDAKYLTRVLNKIGITTVKDFYNKDFRCFLVSITDKSQRKKALLIKVKNPESFRLYEFIEQNVKESYIKHQFYFILINAGVETLDDFCSYNLNHLYFLKGRGDITIGILKELQQKAKVLHFS